MKPVDQLNFSLNDLINGVEIGPAHVPLSLLGEFQKDVADFLRGTSRDVETAEVLVSIETGSLMFAASGLLAATTLWKDLARLKSSAAMALIDPKRASVLERWQTIARENPSRRYTVADKSGAMFFAVDAQSRFIKIEDVWVQVEKYLHGKIVDMGGKTKANVHLELDTGEKTLTISSSHELLAQDERNRLYRPALLHVTAEENLQTGELRNLRLLAFEPNQAEYDDDEFRQMVARGTKAWEDVESATEWTDTLRGG